MLQLLCAERRLHIHFASSIEFFCANVVMVINEVARNHVMTAVPRRRNQPTQNSSPDEHLVHFVHKWGEI